jgi:putative endonuclease
MAARPQTEDRIGRYRRGRLSELVAAATLMAKGYRILARRCRTPYGEIDLIAKRGSGIIFVEVKRRATRSEAEAALSPRQAQRMVRAAEFWINRNPRYRDHEQRMDAILVLPGRLPKHLPGVLGIALTQRR